jgi:hypothetical protein
VPTPSDIDGVSFAALKALVVQLLNRVAEQERLITELRDENARLKGLNCRPRIKPSGMVVGIALATKTSTTTTHCGTTQCWRFSTGRDAYAGSRGYRQVRSALVSRGATRPS